MKEEQVWIKVYNAILNPELSEEERQLLVTFKNRVKKPSEFDRAARELSYQLGKLAVKKLGEETLHPQVSEIYQELASFYARESAVATGLSASGLMF
ncbi:bacteriocin immunity protein [Streptococcus caprae]|uniref:Bacteriocin immunity protein n=1 Tax=Streptococcus caprae TaxID=1640501 RepID=A0ABV8CUJ2_9STRE